MSAARPRCPSSNQGSRGARGTAYKDLVVVVTAPGQGRARTKQDRTPLEPAVRSLLDLVADDPERAFRVFDPGSAAAG